MTVDQLTRQAPGQFSLAGELSFATVPDLAEAGESLFEGVDQVSVDLTEVDRSDSAGLALLVSWTRQARQQGKQLSFHQIPEQLLGLARVSGVDHILPLD